MYHTLTISIDTVLKEMHKVGGVPDSASIHAAYDFAADKHKDKNRISGEPYINHPLRVARFVAEYGFESEVVMAAILHDVVEDCEVTIEEIQEKFGEQVAKLVDALTAVNKKLHKSSSKEEIDLLSDIKFQKHITDKALYLKIFDRIDNLNTIEVMPLIKQRKKVTHTKEMLIPPLKKRHAFALLDELEELCFKVENRPLYDKLNAACQNLRYVNQKYTRKMLDDLKETFTSKNTAYFELPPQHQNLIVDFTFKRRSLISIFRHIATLTNPHDPNFASFVSKQYLPLYDLELVLRDSILDKECPLTPISLFYRYYEHILSQKGFCILGYYLTTHKDSKYFLICDEMNNLYRLFLRTKTESLQCQYGDIVLADHESASHFYAKINETAPKDSYKDQIVVYLKDGSRSMIDEGATVLDLAFQIHSHIGLRFSYALINGAGYKYEAHTPINEYDTIEIVVSEEPTAKIQWFQYIKTSKAVKCLVEYFTSNPLAIAQTTH